MTCEHCVCADVRFHSRQQWCEDRCSDVITVEVRLQHRPVRPVNISHCNTATLQVTGIYVHTATFVCVCTCVCQIMKLMYLSWQSLLSVTIVKRRKNRRPVNLSRH